MRARGERRPLVVLSGTTTPHRCRRPTVALDASELAEAIVAASRAARQERRQTDTQIQQASLAMPVERPAQTTSDRQIPTVAVWTDNGAGD